MVGQSLPAALGILSTKIHSALAELVPVVTALDFARLALRVVPAEVLLLAAALGDLLALERVVDFDTALILVLAAVAVATPENRLLVVAVVVVATIAAMATVATISIAAVAMVVVIIPVAGLLILIIIVVVIPITVVITFVIENLVIALWSV